MDIIISSLEAILISYGISSYFSKDFALLVVFKTLFSY